MCLLSNSDYGFYRHVNTSECVKQPDATNKTLEMCLNGQEDELLTTGWMFYATYTLDMGGVFKKALNVDSWTPF